MSEGCSRCLAGATGEFGHDDLTLYVMGPYPGQYIFQCTTCDERWIRHQGVAAGFAWSRYSEQFDVRKPRAVARSRVTPS